MEALGFQYYVRRKTYYVDGHERPDNVENRREYIRRYFAYERCCFRWIQLPLSDGTCAPNSKEEGQGVMLSSFVSRDFGYGCDLTPSQLDTINQFRENKAYLDEDAAVFCAWK